jgi:hypothetical protein
VFKTSSVIADSSTTIVAPPASPERDKGKDFPVEPGSVATPLSGTTHGCGAGDGQELVL